MNILHILQVGAPTRNMNFVYWVAGAFTILAAIIYNYPVFFYVFIFLLYSVVIVVLGKILYCAGLERS